VGVGGARDGAILVVAIANHGSPRTTKLYDRTREELSFEEVERIMI